MTYLPAPNLTIPPLPERDQALWTISGKELGTLALPHFCPRCFWLKRRMQGKLPFNIFPGIFASIDSFTKGMIHNHLARHYLSPWFTTLSEVQASLPIPHHTSFCATDPATEMTLTGVMDALFLLRDGSYLIVDYKTARHTVRQDSLLPLYAAQLNAYAYIATFAQQPRCQFTPVSQLALVYMEPQSGRDTPRAGRSVTPKGFAMEFAAKVIPITLDLDQIPWLLARAKALSLAPSPPQPRPACEDCARVETMLALLSQRKSHRATSRGSEERHYDLTEIQNSL